MTANIEIVDYVIFRQPPATGRTGQDPNFPASNTLDGNTWSFAGATPGALSYGIEYDMGGNVDVASAGVAGHSAPQSPLALKVEYSDDGSAWTEVLTTPQTSQNGAIFVTFPTEQHRYWALTVQGPGAAGVRPGFGVGWFGTGGVDFPVGVDPDIRPPNQNYENRLLNNFAGGGQILGTRVLEQGGQTSFKFTDLTWSWWEANGQALYDFMRAGRPFMMTWDKSRIDASSYTVTPSTPQVIYKSHGRMDFSFNAITV